MYKTIVNCCDELKRNQVWCTHCGKTLKNIDSSYCLEHGWPKCCGETMSINSPEERKKYKITCEDKNGSNINKRI